MGEVLLLTLLNRQILGQEVIVCKGPFTNDVISEGKGDRQILTEGIKDICEQEDGVSMVALVPCCRSEANVDKGPRGTKFPLLSKHDHLPVSIVNILS